MGNTQIIYAPLTGYGSGTRTVSMGSHPVLSVFDGGTRPTARQTITVGGKAVTIFSDTHDEFEVELEAISKTDDADVFQKVMAWWTHAQQGVEFAFVLDAAKDGDETLTGAHTAGDTAVTISDTTDFAAGEWVRIISASNPGVISPVEIDSIDTGTTLTLERGIQFNHADGDVFRAVDYFPVCVYIGNKPPLTEREAGRGVNLWDLSFKFRSVR